MRDIPTNKGELTVFAEKVVSQCLSSVKERTQQYSIWKSYMAAGSEDASRPSIYNRCGSHVDRLSSFLYSADDIRLLVKFGNRAAERWKRRAPQIAEYLTDEFHGTGCDLAFGAALPWSLVYGACLVKTTWNDEKGLDPYLVMPSQFGVWREDINGLERQEAFCEVSFITKPDLNRRLEQANHPDRVAIMEKTENQTIEAKVEEGVNPLLHQVIIGGVQPVGVGGGAGTASTTGTVKVFNVSPTPNLSPDVKTDIVKVVELWVLDDERDDWTTIQYVDPGVIIEPTKQKRNLLIKGRHPYTLVQPNIYEGYFWGRSEYSDLWRLQDIITQRMDDIEHIGRLRAHPPRAFIGFSGIAEETKAAIGALDGMLIETSPNAKVENLAPEMPQDAYEQLQKVNEFFDEQGGWTPGTLGQGVAGVRSEKHSTQLSRAGGARMRDRALLIERQAGEYGDLCLEILAVKTEGAKQLPDETAKEESEKEFILAQMDDDRTVQVDSHSASPAFASDNQELAFGLKRMGAIDEEGLLMMVHPPQMDYHLKRLRAREAAAAQFAKEHPELAAKGKGKK